jgi:hypothetical protein
MQARKLIALLAVLWAGALASQAQVNFIAPAALEVKTVNEYVADLPPVIRIYATAGTEKFALLVPFGFRLAEQAADRIRLDHQESSSAITFRLLGKPVLPAEPSAEASMTNLVKTMIQQRRAGAVIKDEFAVRVAGQDSFGFDLEWLNAAGQNQMERVVYVPLPEGMLEFSLLATTERMKELGYSLNAHLLTFRKAVNGKLQVEPLSSLF